MPYKTVHGAFGWVQVKPKRWRVTPPIAVWVSRQGDYARNENLCNYEPLAGDASHAGRIDGSGMDWISHFRLSRQTPHEAIIGIAEAREVVEDGSALPRA